MEPATLVPSALSVLEQETWMFTLELVAALHVEPETFVHPWELRVP